MAGPQSTPLSQLEALQRRLSTLSRHPSGNPIFFEDWSYGRAYSVTTSGAGGYEVVNSSNVVGQETVFNGKSMGKITTPGTGVAAYTSLFYNINPLSNLRLGLEVNFAFPYTQAQLALNFTEIYFGITLVKELVGVNQLGAFVRYYPADDSLRLAGTATPWPGDLLLTNVFGTRYFTDWFLIWHNLKLVVDFENEVGVKLFFDDREINLSSYAFQRTVRPRQPVLQFSFGAQDRGASVMMFLGNMIFTTEEP